MKFSSLASQSAKNALRSKSRTALTVIAIFIGAFTLTITSGIGIGINRYIDSTIASIGADDILTVTKLSTSTEPVTDGPQEYDPTQTQAESLRPGPGNDFVVVEAMTEKDFDELASVAGVVSVEPVKNVSVNYIEGTSGTPYVVNLGAFFPGMQLNLAEGRQLDDASADYEIAIAESFLESLGFSSASDALGETVTLGYSDSKGVDQTISAEVVGVTQPGFGPGADNSVPNVALKDALYADQISADIDTDELTYSTATVKFDVENMTDEDVVALQAELESAGYSSTSTADQLGTFTSVIDVIILVLNAFALIALTAAGFGIVNTLFMSVQERTREIGLMKAMGLASSKVFALFSLEAVVIGLMGSALGVGLGMLVGTTASNVLSENLFSDLAGLQLVAFDLTSVLTVVAVVVAIAFLAGAFPAIKAARKDPIESLRYE
jgi:putative ABC transport system permease protein